MALNRDQLLQRKTKIQKPHPVHLPSGDTVLLRVPTGKDYRDWKQSLRDEKGELIKERADVADELLVARLLVDESGSQMFTREDVMNGALDEILQIDLEAIKDEAYGLMGQRAGFKIILDEDREKKSSAAAPSA